MVEVHSADTSLRVHRADGLHGLVPILEERLLHALLAGQIPVVRIIDVRLVERNPDDIVLVLGELGVELLDHGLELRHVIAVHATVAIGHIREVLVGFLHVDLDLAATIALPLVGGVQHVAVRMLHAAGGLADVHAVLGQAQTVERGVAGDAVIGEAVQEACRAMGDLAIGVVGVLRAAGLVKMYRDRGVVNGRGSRRHTTGDSQRGHCGRCQRRRQWFAYLHCYSFYFFFGTRTSVSQAIRGVVRHRISRCVLIFERLAGSGRRKVGGSASHGRWEARIISAGHCNDGTAWWLVEPLRRVLRGFRCGSSCGRSRRRRRAAGRRW